MEIPEDATEDEKAAYEEFNDSERSNVYTNANTFYLQAKIGTENGQSFNDILNEYKKENQSSDEEYDMTTDDADVIKALKEAEVGEVVMVQTDSMIAVGATADIHEDPTDFDYVKDSIRHALRDETMEEYLLQVAQDDSFVLNQDAVDRYTIGKLDLEGCIREAAKAGSGLGFGGKIGQIKGAVLTGAPFFVIFDRKWRQNLYE